MNILKVILLAATLLLLAHSPAFAWSGAGRMVIAAEAYRELSPELKAKVTTILKSHPDYPKWDESYAKAASEIDHDTFIFKQASTWPDEIRRGAGSEKQYNHPHWHYIDFIVVGNEAIRFRFTQVL